MLIVTYYLDKLYKFITIGVIGTNVPYPKQQINAVKK